MSNVNKIGLQQFMTIYYPKHKEFLLARF